MKRKLCAHLTRHSKRECSPSFSPFSLRRRTSKGETICSACSRGSQATIWGSERCPGQTRKRALCSKQDRPSSCAGERIISQSRSHFHASWVSRSDMKNSEENFARVEGWNRCDTGKGGLENTSSKAFRTPPRKMRIDSAGGSFVAQAFR